MADFATNVVTHYRLLVLAQNLAIGAALCSAHLQGGHSMMALLWSHEAWMPGCGRRAP